MNSNISGWELAIILLVVAFGLDLVWNDGDGFTGIIKAIKGQKK